MQMLKMTHDMLTQASCFHLPPSHLQVHNKLNNTHMALMHFSWAMDLDPKGANSQIKDALDPTINNRAAGQEEAGGGGMD